MNNYFPRLMFIDSFCTCFGVRIRFRYQRCDNYVDLHIIYIIYMLRMTIGDSIRGWFYYVFKVIHFFH